MSLPRAALSLLSSHRSTIRNMTVSTAGPTKAESTASASVSRDFRSDTVTAPTDAMFEAMRAATRCDDVYREDASTADFENRIAKMCGKEAALFVASGTMSNQLGIRTWLTQPPHSVLCDARAHVHVYEAGGIAFHSQAVGIPVSPSNGHTLTLEDLEPVAILTDDIHFAPTRLVCLENTIKGLVHPQAEIIRISDHFRAKGIKMHLDGARLWEVSAKTGKSMDELARPFDSLSLCMSKGLGAPFGSVLVGPGPFITKARAFRKLFGGGIRQSGSLAAAAEFALDNNFPLLKRTHSLATSLASRLHALGCRILLPVETNHVFFDTSPLGIDIWHLVKLAEQRHGIKLGGTRIIVHVQTSALAVDQVVELVEELKLAAEREGKASVGEGKAEWEEEGRRHVKGELWEGLAKGTVEIKRKGVGYAGN